MSAPALVSVIIPAFNGVRFLPDAVASIREQEYPALEIVIVDDGSTDNLAEAAARVAPDALYLRQENQGPAAARNLGIAHARGDLIAALDIDDLWTPDTLRLLLQALQREPTADIARGRSRLLRWSADTQRWNEEVQPGGRKLIGAALFRAGVFSRIGAFNAAFRYSEEVEWNLRAADAGVREVLVDAVVHCYRQHGSNMTHNRSIDDLQIFGVLRAVALRRRMAGSASTTE